jgi:adenosyl cobinamide kinase/adenosyl cobinamide phosphate guanylyltransferase
MPEERASSPVDLFIQSSRELFSPESLVAEAAKDLVRDEVKKHLEKKMKENPALAKELKEAVKELLEAKALEYSALIRVTAAVAKLGIASVPEDMRDKLAKELAGLVSRELGAVMDRTL